MHLVVTAGPTFEPLDQVRRLTNFSTGRLGAELASFLARHGHRVTLLLSEQAVHRETDGDVTVVPFSTTETLREALAALTRTTVNAVFHAAAVSDFTFGTVWQREAGGKLIPVQGGKIPTRAGTLMAELIPTPKVIAELRDLFPDSWLVGWKYEVDGERGGVVAAAEDQIRDCCTSACVANGPAYGRGYGLVFKGGQHFHVPDAEALFAELLRRLI